MSNHVSVQDCVSRNRPEPLAAVPAAFGSSHVDLAGRCRDE
jgi:hypothetical protein